MNYFLSVIGHSLMILIIREVLLTIMLTNCDQLIGFNVLDIDINLSDHSNIGYLCM